MTMTKIGIAELKAKLSEHIRAVRRGHELTVYDRNEPVARVLPYSPKGALVVREPIRQYKTLGDVKLPPPLKLKVDPLELLRAGLKIVAPDAEATRGFVRLCLARAREWPRRHYDPVVEERGSRVVLGTLRLSLRERSLADLGYAIRRDRWNRGFATEAVAALLSAARIPLGLREVWATVDPANAASCRVMEKLGFSSCAGEAGAPIKPGRPASAVYLLSLAPAERVSERAVSKAIEELKHGV